MIAKAEDENASAFAISKEDIDSVLQKGSGVADGKYRIYRQFQKGEDRQKNIEFLKNEYGTGGGTHIFPDGFSGHSWHDSKGLAIELYSVQRYLQYDTLAQNGLQHFDSWASTFGETVTALELAPEGTNYRAKTRFAKFYNLPELMQMFREVADIQTADAETFPAGCYTPGIPSRFQI